MDLKTILAALVRRWYLVLLVIGFSVGATLFVAAKVGPTYEAQGAVLVFPPVATVQRGAKEVTQGNPYLALDGVSQARDIVIRELTSKKTADEFDIFYPGTTFEATPDVMNNAPIILITVESPAADTAVTAVSELMARIPTTLTGLQKGLGLDSNSVITSKPLIADEQPEPLHKEQIRAAVVAAVLALGLGLLVIGLLDGLLTGRLKKKASVKLPETNLPSDLVGRQRSATADRKDLDNSTVSERLETVEHARPAGVASTRLRPRSPAPTAAAVPVYGGARHGQSSDDRTRNGSHSTADPAQRR